MQNMFLISLFNKEKLLQLIFLNVQTVRHAITAGNPGLDIILEILKT